MNIQKKLLTFMRKKNQIKHEKTDYKFFKKIIVLVLRKYNVYANPKQYFKN